MGEFLPPSVSVPDHVLMRELDGESVILNLESENYFGLDDIGTRMWQLLANAGSVQNAFDSLLLEYDAEPEQLAGDLQELVSELIKLGLLEP